ncbi:Rho GTPase-activating protein SYDE2 [Manis javanica]|nr:Rho GTPase-activating protein SYDE2 [Manis javanica]
MPLGPTLVDLNIVKGLGDACKLIIMVPACRQLHRGQSHWPKCSEYINWLVKCYMVQQEDARRGAAPSPSLLARLGSVRESGKPEYNV